MPSTTRTGSHEPHRPGRIFSALRDTSQVARRATAFEPNAQRHLPPLAQSRRRTPRSWKAHRAELLRLAACLVIGITTGWALFATQPAKPEAPADTSQPETFWSITYLAKKYLRPSVRKHRPVRYELRWGPPIRIQKVEGTYETSVQ